MENNSQLQEQVLYLSEEMDKVRQQLNSKEINMYQARLMMEFLQNELYAITGNTELIW